MDQFAPESVDRAPVQDQFHPIDSQDASCPYQKLAELRRSCPVSRADREEFPPVTVLTKYEDVVSVFRNWRSFGNIGSDPDPRRHDASPTDQRTLIALDPPHHTWARRLNNLAMAPGAVEAALPYIAEVAESIVDRFAGRGEAELVGEWAEPLPSVGIARVLGLPSEDAAILHEWVVSQFTERAAAAAGQRYGGAIVLGGEFGDYLLDQIEQRRRPDAPDDAITRMVRFRRDDGSHFTNTEISVQVRTLINAGNETTTSLLSNLVYRLLDQPGLYERVQRDRSLLAPAIEESLRLDTPLQVIIRRASSEAVIGGSRVAPGEVLALSTLSADRDEGVWGANADEFVLERFAADGAPAHLGFGVGIHHCVGAYLARQTALRGMHALFDRVPSMRLEPGYEYENVFRHVFHRPRRLPVQFPA